MENCCELHGIYGEKTHTERENENDSERMNVICGFGVDLH